MALLSHAVFVKDEPERVFGEIAFIKAVQGWTKLLSISLTGYLQKSDCQSFLTLCSIVWRFYLMIHTRG